MSQPGQWVIDETGKRWKIVQVGPLKVELEDESGERTWLPKMFMTNFAPVA